MNAMSRCHPPLIEFLARNRRNGRSMALLITLTVLTVTSILLVLFISLMQQDRAATVSYSKSLINQDLAIGALQAIIEDFRNEMERDQPGDCGPGRVYAACPIYTNLTSTNVLPLTLGTNSSMPALIRISTNAYAFTGQNHNSFLCATTLSTAVVSRNGRFINTNRWNKPQLGKFPSTATLPYWILITRSGLTNAAGIAPSFNNPPSGATLNNSSATNLNYVIGRVAYAIYDEGSLLDITVAGHPTTLTISDLNQIKGTLAAADLTRIKDSGGNPLIDPDKLIAWRNPTTGINTNTFMRYVTGVAVTNSWRKVAPGDTTFLTRQDLIKAAQSGQAGINTNALPYLATFTREKNIPTWVPSTNAPAGGNYKYKDNAFTTGSTNRAIIGVRLASQATITCYHDDGSPYTSTIHPGEPLVQHRFSLAKLAWLTKSGPALGISDQAIQSCFGLKWVSSSIGTTTAVPTPTAMVWKYVGTSSSPVRSDTPIETLDQVAAESVKREPNFFELLQAGILSGSLGFDGGASFSSLGSPCFLSINQNLPAFQIFKIAANIIDQFDNDSYPTIIEFTCKNQNTYQICGVESLPYVNIFAPVCAASPDSPSDSIATYGLLGLWNTHQKAATQSNSLVPPVRVYYQGTLKIQHGWAKDLLPGVSIPDAMAYGVEDHVNAVTVALSTGLSGSGVYGFLDPAKSLIAPGDVVNVSPATTQDAWVQTPAMGTAGSPTTVLQGDQYVAIRFKDMLMDYSTNREALVKLWIAQSKTTQNPNGQNKAVDIATNFIQTVPGLLVAVEYQQPSGAWVPYSLLAGYNANNNGSIFNNDSRQSYHNPWKNVGAVDNDFQNYSAMKTRQPQATFAVSDVWGDNGMLNFQRLDPSCTRLIPFIFLRWQWGNSNGPAGVVNQMFCAGFKPLWTTRDNLINSDPLRDQTAFAISGFGGTDWFRSGGVGNNPQMQNVPANVASGGASKAFFPATLCRNTGAAIYTDTSSGNTVVADNDGIARIGDCGLYGDPFTTGPIKGNPYSNVEDRPIQLDRIFSSVADLGYTPRDNPWRTLNFFSTDSADAGLLDLFCTNEAAVDNVAAGKINLNTQNKTVLEAVISGSITNASNNTVISNPAVWAASLSAYTSPSNTSGGPLINKSELVTRFLDPKITPAGSTAPDDLNIKTRREGIVRALADVGQTQTWNLMIDIIAQSGKYAPDSKTMDQFTVEGEHRYWLHIAIDRITGKIIDQQLESVSE